MDSNPYASALRAGQMQKRPAAGVFQAWCENLDFCTDRYFRFWALFGQADGPDQCPVLGLNRTWPNDAAMSQFDPKRPPARPRMRQVRRTRYKCHCIIECGLLTGTYPRRALWPAVMRTAQTGRTHGCTDQRRDVRFFLPTRSRPHMAHNGRTADVRLCLLSAYRLMSRRARRSGALRLAMPCANCGASASSRTCVTGSGSSAP
jgi:hypothetical protein